MTNEKQIMQALRAAEEFLLIVGVYYRDGSLLQGAPKKLVKEFGDALRNTGSKCSEAIAAMVAANN